MSKMGRVPRQRKGSEYKRKITPGSRIMSERLEKIGILDIYRRAGFEVGAAGCSYCLGVAYDRAQEGEVWLSSQNRNFRNRMGKGAIGNVTSAAVVAISSFDMEISDPTEVLRDYVDYKKYYELTLIGKKPIKITEPARQVLTDGKSIEAAPGCEITKMGVINGRCQVFGDGIDTDAIIPACHITLRGMEQGEKSFCIYRPEFAGRVKAGQSILVAGTGFGCGSSREEAVSCLRYLGVKAVIAKSFSFIFGRNLLTLSLLGLQIQDEDFYKLAQENTEIEINVPERSVRVMSNPEKHFPFDLPEIQEFIYERGGIVNMYKHFKQLLFSELAQVSAISCGSCAEPPAW
eukprot:GHVN01066397.1.p1 GENE.GHVN01066397.1~~GHVN01066397.1.p1  ORF type:complete len:347 (+),score=23.64 GHVN01066397.1:1166-2206(+)